MCVSVQMYNHIYAVMYVCIMLVYNQFKPVIMFESFSHGQQQLTCVMESKDHHLDNPCKHPLSTKAQHSLHYHDDNTDVEQ